MLLSEVKQFKVEASDEEIHRLLNTHCRDALSWAKTPIVRGDRSLSKKFYVLDPTAGLGRKSRNTSNFYTQILDDVLPPQFPKRSKSFICGNFKNQRYAGSYGEQYAMVPFDGVRIGVCPYQDMWNSFLSFPWGKIGIEEMNDFYEYLNLADSKFNGGFKSFVSKMHKNLQSESRVYSSKQFDKLANHLRELSVEDLYDTLVNAYTYEFEACTSKNPTFNDGKTRELWVGGKCVAIKLGVYKRMMEIKVN